MQITWQGWALLSAVFAALTAIFAKIGVDELRAQLRDPDPHGGHPGDRGRHLGGLEGAGVNPFQSGKVIGALVLSGTATGLSWLCYFQALKLGDASRVAPLDKLSVVFVAVLAAIFLGERLDVKGWAGVGLIAAGAVLIAVRRWALPQRLLPGLPAQPHHHAGDAQQAPERRRLQR